jgi:hypothetical protein
MNRTLYNKLADAPRFAICTMTMAQIQQLKTKKVLFKEFE